MRSLVFTLVLPALAIACGGQNAERGPRAGEASLSSAPCACMQGSGEGAAGQQGRPPMSPRMEGRGGMGMGMMGQGQGMGTGMGRMQGGPMGGAAATSETKATPLSDDAKGALFDALAAEREAEDRYDAMIGKLGASMPLAPLARSERRHAWVLESLALAHGLEVPARPPAAKIAEPANTAAACTAGAANERKIIDLYIGLEKRELPADLRRAFEHLRMQSEHHELALKRCAEVRK